MPALRRGRVMGDLAFIRNVIETLPSLVEMARLHPELSHEAVAARWLSVPSSYVVPLSYTASEELSDTIQQAEADLAVLKARRCETCVKWSDDIGQMNSDLRECETWHALVTATVSCSFWAERRTG
jgi:hypothetical protein